MSLASCRSSWLRLAVLVSLLAPASAGCVVEYEASPAETESGDEEETSAELPECGADELFCDGECIDTAWDSNHCGGCGDACLVGTECIAGQCLGACGPGCDDELRYCDAGVCRCRPELVNCNGLCVDVAGDPGHCGGCFDECSDEAPSCGDGECQPDCAEFEDACEGTCTDFEHDPFNCGGCGVVCDHDELCAGGECVAFLELDPVQCVECPCPEVCDFTCCWYDALGVNVCIAEPACPPE